jgi:zinc transporter ZupT
MLTHHFCVACVWLSAGVQARLDSTALSVFLAIIAHKCVEALTVSSNFVKEHVQLSAALPVILVYCFMTPLGIVTGLVMDTYFQNAE